MAYKCMLWHRLEFDLIALPECYVFGFYSVPDLSGQPIPMDNGEHLHPGDIVVKLGGKKTSAGFTRITMHEGYGLEYVGSKLSFDGEILCFRQVKNGKRQPIKTDGDHWVNKYKIAYYGFKVLKPGTWFHCNQAGSGRIVETENAEVLRKEKISCNKSELVQKT